MKLFSCILLLAALGFAQPPDPDEAGKKKIIEETRARALGYSKELPDFVCTQLTRRNIDPKANNQWKKLDTINEQLSFVNHQEEYRVIAVNGQKSNSERNRPAESFSSNEFVKLLLDTFDPKTEAEFAWSQWDTLRGHRVHVLGYRVKADHSKFTVGKSKNPITVGYTGVVDVDSESGAILKIGMVATDIPAKHTIQGVSEELNYEFAKIGDHYYVLPLKAELRAKENKSLTWNEVEFSNYRKPGAETASAK